MEYFNQNTYARYVPALRSRIPLPLFLLFFFFFRFGGVVGIGFGKGFGESRYVARDRAFVSQKLDVGTVNLDLTGVALLLIFVPAQRSEPPVFGNNDLLAARELVLRPAEGLDGGCPIYFVIALAIESFTVMRNSAWG